MEYKVCEGKDPYIFFLHGWGGSLSSFLMLNNYFENGKVFLSFAGFGNSPEPGMAYTVQDYANELYMLIKKITSGKIIIVCHSFGARVAAKIASQHPDIMEKLVIIDGAGLKPKRGLSYYKKVAKYKKAKRQVLRGKLDKSELEKYGSSDYKKLSFVMKGTFIRVVNEDLKRDFKKIRCETLLIWGSEDKETPLYMARRLNRLIKNSSLVILEGAGHFCYLEQPSQFITLLASFI